MEKKYVYLKHSNLFPEAGEGIFASINVPANTVYAQYNGMLYNSNEHKCKMHRRRNTFTYLLKQLISGGSPLTLEII